MRNEDFRKLSEFVSESGVLVPTLVRPKPDGRHEMVSGHRRKKTSEYAGRQRLPCTVRELTEDEATIIIVDSDLHREKVLPSKTAYAYKLKLEAIKYQGSRSDITSGQVVTRFRTDNMIAE
ncbi:MAG: ParB N-terminal domain-containing protein [Bacilli bacterium]|nr:ParB N-terminal domain-containing protein [Bacilli bacterium]